MNAKVLNTNKLIESICNRALLPTTQVTFQLPDFLLFINEEMDLGVAPFVMSYHEDYFLFSEEIELQYNVTRYQIPSRAIGTKLRDVCYFTSNSRQEMTRISVEDLADRYYNFDSFTLRAFYIEGDEIVIPKPQAVSGNKLIVSYYIRPNALVSEDDVAVVTNVNKYNGIVAVDKHPDVFFNQTMFDITSSRSSFRLVAKDVVPDGTSTENNLTFTFGTIRQCEYTFPTLTGIGNSSYIQLIDNSQGTNLKFVFWFDKTGSDPAPVIPGASLYRVNCSSATDTEDVIDLLIPQFNAVFSDTRLIMSKITPSIINIQSGGAGVSVGNNFSVISNGLIISENVLAVGSVTIPERLGKDDVIALPEQTTIPQIPIELHAMLAQRAAMRCLEALNDTQGLQAAQIKLQDMEAKTSMLINNRVESAPLKILPRHTPIKRTIAYRR